MKMITCSKGFPVIEERDVGLYNSMKPTRWTVGHKNMLLLLCVTCLTMIPFFFFLCVGNLDDPIFCEHETLEVMGSKKGLETAFSFRQQVFML